MIHYRRIFFEKGIDYVATPTTGAVAPTIRLAHCWQILIILSALSSYIQCCLYAIADLN